MIIRLFAYCVALPIILLPRPLHSLAGRLVGAFAYYALPKRRKIVEANLKIAFPKLSDSERADLLSANYHHMGRFALDVLQNPFYRIQWILKRRIRLIGREHIEKATENGKKAVLLGSHIGSWEATGILSLLENHQIVGVYKPMKGLIGKYVQELRSVWSIRLVPKRVAKVELAKALEDGDIPGLICDQGGHTKYDFLGHPAVFPGGPGYFWGEMGATPVVIMAVRAPDGNYDCHCLPMNLPPRDSVPPEERKGVLTREYIRMLEEWILKYPDQYFWVHDIWRTFKND